jgi:hypothetical protein
MVRLVVTGPVPRREDRRELVEDVRAVRLPGSATRAPVRISGAAAFRWVGKRPFGIRPFVTVIMLASAPPT